MSTSTRALLIVDVQNDFVEGGSLGVTGGREVAGRISDHLAEHADDYALVVASRDWHEPHSTNGGHFAEQGDDPDFRNTWPVHCVQTEGGSDYAPGLDLSRVTHHVLKGQGVPAYSAFQGSLDDGTSLVDLLRAHDVTDLDVVGIATDYCVRASVLDARSNRFEVRVLDGLHAGVAPDTSAAALEKMEAQGATRVSV